MHIDLAAFCLGGGEGTHWDNTLGGKCRGLGRGGKGGGIFGVESKTLLYELFLIKQCSGIDATAGAVLWFFCSTFAGELMSPLRCRFETGYSFRIQRIREHNSI